MGLQYILEEIFHKFINLINDKLESYKSSNQKKKLYIQELEDNIIQKFI